MYLQNIKQNLLNIEQLIDLNQYPQKTILLFYSTVKMIQKSNQQKSKQFTLPTECFQFLTKSCYYNKNNWKVQQLLNHFLYNNKQVNNKIDKVHSHMLQITAEMIANINQTTLKDMYPNQPSQKLIDNNDTNKKSCSQSSFSKFQHLFTNTIDDIDENSNNISSAESKSSKNISPKSITTQQKQQLPQQNISNSKLSSSILTSQLNIQTLIKLYQQHKLDRAYQLLIAIETQAPQLLKIENPTFNTKFIQQLKEEYTQMTHFYDHFNLDGYKMDKTQDNVIMHYKIMEKENLVAIQVQSQVDLSLQKFICIASEIQLYDKYVPFNYETLCLKLVARNKKIGRSKVFIPLLNNRQAYFQAKAYDRLQNQNCIFIFSKNLKKQQLAALGIEYKAEGLVDLDYIFFLLSYTPVSKDQGIVKMATCVDLKISILPKFILNKTARIFAFDYFKNMININKKFQNSPWEKAIINNPQHYNFFKQKIDEYFTSKSNRNQQST